ncbi:hypothetical protein AVEN_156172-1 [Araneus ventricosus]|uniref:Uncharacterized protein n=1 Tax=Araneus ventricosus TaxID=182803 RepID=A0A4Y2D4W0_ARAVE|nr:hypothetical protein AVEN_156172-1 [Araneus ventricosus]
MILVSRRWSRSCMIFFRPQRCRRFDVLPDSRYSRYTREMVVPENPNFIATSEMSNLLCADYNTTFKLTYILITCHCSSSNRSNNCVRHLLSYIGAADRSAVL